MADITTNTPVQAGLNKRFQAALKSLTARYAQYRVYRETMNELQGLSNRDQGSERPRRRIGAAEEHGAQLPIREETLESLRL